METIAKHRIVMELAQVSQLIGLKGSRNLLEVPSLDLLQRLVNIQDGRRNMELVRLDDTVLSLHQGSITSVDAWCYSVL